MYAEFRVEKKQKNTMTVLFTFKLSQVSMDIMLPNPSVLHASNISDYWVNFLVSAGI